MLQPVDQGLASANTLVSVKMRACHCTVNRLVEHWCALSEQAASHVQSSGNGRLLLACATMQNFPPDANRIITITGKADAVERAVKMVQDLMTGDPGTAQQVIQKVLGTVSPIHRWQTLDPAHMPSPLALPCKH
jgi:hypothetical protein